MTPHHRDCRCPPCLEGRSIARARGAEDERARFRPLLEALAGLRGEIHDAGEVDTAWLEVDRELDRLLAPVAPFSMV